MKISFIFRAQEAFCRRADSGAFVHRTAAGKGPENLDFLKLAGFHGKGICGKDDEVGELSGRQSPFFRFGEFSKRRAGVKAATAC